MNTTQLLIYMYFVIGLVICTVLRFYIKNYTTRHGIVLILCWPLFLTYLTIAIVMLTIFELITTIHDSFKNIKK
jgi:hypothetical protein